MKTETEIREALRAWVTKASAKGRKKKPPTQELTDQTLILETRMISSLQLMELILLVQELRGSPVDRDGLSLDSFSSIDAIHTNFFSGMS